eukprot:TRINITY_DN4403_c0_g1_i2.p1 TRINITY_DN4403_c0_g1~~TRINITY_DN4403_c0_g1_i2.p1  ORF type:complete len:418 (-),score=18.51 TRINITY_DN4403_c0_g1_i2:220-1473(-)
MQDSVRIDIAEAMEKCRGAGVAVRLVTGDSVEAAKTIARRAGILTEAELKHGTANLVMEGGELEEYVGGIVMRVDEETGSEVKAVRHEYKFMRVSRSLKLLAKASPSHKLLLTLGLKSEAQNTVLVAGSKPSDQEALQAADIALSSSNSSDTAKEAANAILKSNSLASVVSAIKWSRNVLQGVRKQVQFQAITGLTAVLTACVGCLCFGETPLSAVHLLWINIVVNVFSAVCLPCDPPSESVLRSKPYAATKPLVNTAVWNCVIIVTGYQVTLLVLLMFLGGIFFGSSLTEDEEVNWFTENKKLNTVLFTVYIYLSVATFFCCRAIKPKGNSHFNNRIQCIFQYIGQHNFPFGAGYNSWHAGCAGKLRSCFVLLCSFKAECAYLVCGTCSHYLHTVGNRQIVLQPNIQVCIFSLYFM